jgi:hypothetical protein
MLVIVAMHTAIYDTQVSLLSHNFTKFNMFTTTLNTKIVLTARWMKSESYHSLHPTSTTQRALLSAVRNCNMFDLHVYFVSHSFLYICNTIYKNVLNGQDV